MPRYVPTMATTAIQAPSRTFVANTTTRTTPVSTAPVRLIACARRMRARPGASSPGLLSWRCQCRTMPAWLSVKLVNTPRM
jgi:hypothetical protein